MGRYPVPRAEYNTFCEVYNGPDAVPPDAYRGLAIGRLVFETRVRFQGLYPATVEAYFTTNSLLISAGVWSFGAGNAILDLGRQSVLWFPTEGYACQVAFFQTINPRGGTPYRRYYLVGM